MKQSHIIKPNLKISKKPSSSSDLHQQNNEQVTVDSRDVVKLMLQFCMENNMTESFKAISKESGLTCNTMLPQHRKQFLTSIEKGSWTFVLETLQQPYLTFSKGLLIKLYEHVIFELIELSEENVARFLMNNIQVISVDLREEEPARFKKLEHVVNNAKHFDNLIAYDGKNKNDIRRELSSLFQQEILSIPSSSMLNIIGNAIQYQKMKQGDDFDPNTFHLLDHTVKNIKKSSDKPTAIASTTQVKQEEDDSMESDETTNAEIKILDRPYKIIKFGKKTQVNCCHFVSDYLIVGTSDGFVEIYDYLTGKMNKELAYQANDELIVHEDSVTCVGTKVQPSGILLATSAIDKTIKLWNLLTGKCLLKIPTATGANCIYFSDYDNTIISGYPNGSIKVHGLTSGGTELKDLSGHTSFINCIIQLDNEHMLSCSSDGSIRKWNTKSQHCEKVYTLSSMRKPKLTEEESSSSTLDLPIQQILKYPNMEGFLFVCYPSNSISVLNMETGREVFKFVSNKEEDVFVSITHDNNYLYGATNSNKCCIYQIPSHIPMKCEEITPLRTDDLQHKKTVHSLSLHESILLSFSQENINLWK